MVDNIVQAVSFISFIFVVVSTVGMTLNTMPSMRHRFLPVYVDICTKSELEPKPKNSNTIFFNTKFDTFSDSNFFYTESDTFKNGRVSKPISISISNFRTDKSTIFLTIKVF